MTKTLISLAALSLLFAGCNKTDDAAAQKEGSNVQAAADKPAEAPAAKEPSCEDVVNKLASFDDQAGEPERKLWTKACATMPPEMKTCLVAAKSAADRDACGSKKKAIEGE